MTFERFSEILREYGIPENAIAVIWADRPHGPLNELSVRYAAKMTARDFGWTPPETPEGVTEENFGDVSINVWEDEGGNVPAAK